MIRVIGQDFVIGANRLDEVTAAAKNIGLGRQHAKPVSVVWWNRTEYPQSWFMLSQVRIGQCQTEMAFQAVGGTGDREFVVKKGLEGNVVLTTGPTWANKMQTRILTNGPLCLF